ncbi:LAMI_0C01112g1_1 [Lachancea mirantina]|uniref:LAMI_0C01112g1_1 n=1 Tax=Lachancea mirantina TaxID=1230905 RepID=A0A1G4J024_9SACH|nr:LAMI_0C01112g1_1 [Lachancea mirantina]
MPFYSFLLRPLARKVFGDVEIGSAAEDPYFEEVQFEKRSFWSGSTKLVRRRRDKSIPNFVPELDRKILKRIRKRAYRLDMMFHLFGIRFGWIGIIGLLPLIGDMLVLWLSLTVLREAQTITGGLPPAVSAEMVFNIAIDFGLGLIPLVGDLVSVYYKANSRNTLLLEHYLTKKYRIPGSVAAVDVAAGKKHP